ncbi:amidohydrolase family protein [Alteromonas sp. ASW11-130]|uniref:amidohydrolase family protein n=1 Tax=Alteromonas sp. ASW11-130 TaxID=3015775 RepID=UPI002242B1F7|nr:amidohydrolase family protein [Alteromonas sp. ASW11-130]MCW8093089.1 amidohydrolase family protein [Alteromonas sp. ASW11-130]
MYISNTNIVDVVQGQVVEHQTIAIQDEKIIGITPTSSTPLKGSQRAIDGTGLYAIPGLWDMHVHLSHDDIARNSMLPLYIVYGVTGVRDMKGDCFECNGYGDYSHHTVKQWVADIHNNKLVGPYIIASSDIIHDIDDVTKLVQQSKPSTNLVEELIHRGVHSIKLYDEVEKNAFYALMEEANRSNLPVTGHVPFSVKASEASRLKMKSMEHLSGVIEECSSEEDRLRRALETATGEQDSDYTSIVGQYIATFDSQKCSRLIDTLKQNHTWQVPTLSILFNRKWQSDSRINYVSAQERKFWQQLERWERKQFGGKTQGDIPGWNHLKFQVVKQMYQQGIKILAGTDSSYWGIFPGSALHQELELLVRAGVSDLDALRAATIYPVQYLEQENVMGSIEAGKFADIVLLESNPVKEIGNTRKIHTVIVRGKVYDKAAREQLLMQIEHYVENSIDNNKAKEK